MLKIPMCILDRHSDLKPTYRRIYLILRDCLVEGSLEINDGDKLTEKLISDSLGVSRTPVRAAMAQLKSEGLLDHLPKSRLGVRELSHEDKLALIDIAVILEGAAASLAAKNATEDDIDVLWSLNESIRGFSAHGRSGDDLQGIWDLHGSFHQMVGKLSGNRFLYKFIIEIRHLLRMLSEDIQVDETTFPLKFAPVHDGLIASLARCDPDAAKYYMSTDLLNAKSIYLRSISDSE